MVFHIGPPAITSLCKPRSQYMAHLSHIQWICRVKRSEKQLCRCFPLTIICTLWDNSHRTSSIAIIPGEEAAWKGSGQNTHPCSWTSGWWRQRSSQQTFGFLHPRWVTPPLGYDLFLLGHSTEHWSTVITAASPAIDIVLQVDSGDSGKSVFSAA